MCNRQGEELGEVTDAASKKGIVLYGPDFGAEKIRVPSGVLGGRDQNSGWGDVLKNSSRNHAKGGSERTISPISRLKKSWVRKGSIEGEKYKEKKTKGPWV